MTAKTTKPKPKRTKWQVEADRREELRQTLYGKGPSNYSGQGPEHWLKDTLHEARAEALVRLVRKFPSLTRAQVTAALELNDIQGWAANRLVDALLAKLDGPLGKALAPLEPKPAKKKAPAKAAKTEKSAKASPKAAKSKTTKAAKSKTAAAKPAPKAPKASKAPKTPRKSLTDRVLEVLEAKRPASVAKPILRKELGNVSGTGLDKAIAKLLEEEKIVGSDPYSLTGVVDDTVGPLFGEAAE